jgi:hypothetical protein
MKSSALRRETQSDGGRKSQSERGLKVAAIERMGEKKVRH